MGVSPNGKARDFDSRIIGSIPVTPAKDVVAEQVDAMEPQDSCGELCGV